VHLNILKGDVNFAARSGGRVSSMPTNLLEKDVDIDLRSLSLPGRLSLPEKTKGLVVFAHGSGSSRLSPRNTYVARILQGAGIGTLLFDLLTEEEDRTYRNRFDIGRIADRLVQATRWLSDKIDTKNLALGYFGASTGAAAALFAAATLKPKVKAVVSRGGRPDMAMEVLHDVGAPTLLIVGEQDEVVLGLNRDAFRNLAAPRKLEIIPGATHLFEEPGALARVTELAADWFARHLVVRAAQPQ